MFVLSIVSNGIDCIMQVLISDIYHSSSSECNKIRIDRYRAKIGPSNEEYTIIKILRWLHQPILELDRNKTYIAEIRSSEYTNSLGFKYMNLDVILIGEYNEGKPTDCIYSFILNKSKKATDVALSVGPNPDKDDLPF